MTTALIGHTGFVGGTLCRAAPYDALFNSANFHELEGRAFERVVCAGVSAAKWIANREPEADRARIDALADVLDTVRAERFVLISTVDVYPETAGADEDSDPRGRPNHAYGTNRLAFEDRVRARFPEALIVRLPALFGEGLKKNVVFDLLHDNGLDAINPDGLFQWYDLSRLAADIATAERAGLRLVNLVTEPLSTRDILAARFVGMAVGAKAGPAGRYDLRTRHAALFGGAGPYVMDRAAVLEALCAYIDGQRRAA